MDQISKGKIKYFSKNLSIDFKVNVLISDETDSILVKL